MQEFLNGFDLTANGIVEINDSRWEKKVRGNPSHNQIQTEVGSLKFDHRIIQIPYLFSIKWNPRSTTSPLVNLQDVIAIFPRPKGA